MIQHVQVKSFGKMVTFIKLGLVSVFYMATPGHTIERSLTEFLWGKQKLTRKLGLQGGARIVRQEHKTGDLEGMKMTKRHKSNAIGQTKCQQIAMETDGSCKATYNSMCK